MINKFVFIFFLVFIINIINIYIYLILPPRLFSFKFLFNWEISLFASMLTISIFSSVLVMKGLADNLRNFASIKL